MEELLAKKVEELKGMTADELISAYDHVRDLNLSKKNYGLGEPSMEYQMACYKEIIRRMSK